MSANANPARTRQPARFGVELARQLLQRCSEPGYAPGGRLPTERRLAAEFAVTRTTVRRALSLLEAQGRISREVGRGTFLLLPGEPGAAGARSLASAAAAPAEVSPADVMAARRLIEPQILPLVVAWATRRDFDELDRCLAGGNDARTYEEFEHWDFALHHALIVASRNQLLVSMYELVEHGRTGQIWGNLKRRSDSTARRAVYQADHVELVGALHNRETEHAIQVMDAHLARVQANLLEPATVPHR